MQGTGRPSKTYSQDRVCKEPDCGTQLSIYNRGKYCYAALQFSGGCSSSALRAVERGQRVNGAPDQ